MSKSSNDNGGTMRKSAKRSDPEGITHRAVWKHILKRGVPGLFAFHVPNGGKRGIKEAVNFKRMGVTPGVPDLVMMLPAGEHTRVYTMEFKAPGKKLSEKQTECWERLDKVNAFQACCGNVDSALRVLEAWKILRGTAA